MTTGRIRALPISGRHAHGAVQVVAGLALAAFPAFYLAIYARIAPVEQQGFLAVSLAIGSYVAAVLCAFVVESRLATPNAEHPRALPRWQFMVSLGSGALLIVGPPVPPAPILLIGIIGLMSGLLMARSIGVVSGRWAVEAVAALILLIACSVALVLARSNNGHCVRVLAAGAVLAICVRLWHASPPSGLELPPDLRRAAWVTGETAVVGVVLPALTSLILLMLGPAASVTFRVVTTISGALEPILAYGRIRLLAHGHRGEIAVVIATFAVGLAVIFVTDYLGGWQLIFGPAWAGVTLVALLLACLWKGLMLVSTVPFAALRRAGNTELVFWVRCVTTVVYLAIGLTLVAVFRTNTAAFASFVLAELVAILLYFTAAKNVARRGV